MSNDEVRFTRFYQVLAAFPPEDKFCGWYAVIIYRVLGQLQQWIAVGSVVYMFYHLLGGHLLDTSHNIYIYIYRSLCI